MLHKPRDMICRRSGNDMGLTGWGSILGELERHLQLERLGKVVCPGLLTGKLEILDLGGGYEKPCQNETGMAISFLCYLPRSANYLTELDMR
jgi:hypothetical protein